jgi:hypothetical protein
MHLFVSWSGEDSRAVAEILRTWIPDVIQEAEVYVSSQDIEKGERWALNLAKSLEELDFGLIALTKTNVTAPWVLFEAGALSKTVRSRLVPILCNLTDRDLVGSPLAHFQYARFAKADFLQLMQTINASCGRPLPEARLEKAFETWWPALDRAVGQVTFADSIAVEAKPSGDDRLTRLEEAVDELLHATRKILNATSHADRTVQVVPTEAELRAMNLYRAIPQVDTVRFAKKILRDMEHRGSAKLSKESGDGNDGGKET